MREVRARVAEGDTRERRSPHQRIARLVVGRVGDAALEVAADELHRLAGGEVAERVGALDELARGGIGDLRMTGVGARGPALQRVAAEVEAGARHHLARQAVAAGRIHDRLVGQEMRARDDELAIEPADAQHRDRGALGARARGGGTGEVRQYRPGNGLAAAHRWRKVVQAGSTPASDHQRRLGGVDDRAATHRDHAVDARLGQEASTALGAVVVRFDTDVREHRALDTGRGQRLARPRDQGAVDEHRVGEQRHPFQRAGGGAGADLAERAASEAELRHRDREGVGSALRRREILTAHGSVPSAPPKRPRLDGSLPRALLHRPETPTAPAGAVRSPFRRSRASGNASRSARRRQLSLRLRIVRPLSRFSAS